jgi:peptidoglycan/xylan/chitin deacetylase (PgdA/CDA1 family)
MFDKKNIPNLYIIWDFDSAMGQINSTYPYNYHEKLIYKEIENVEKILEYSSNNNVPMIFAITGFAAERGLYPFHIPDLIKEIHLSGHEIASHSWRHEWLPFLELEQIVRTLNRSKLILEECIGEKNSIKGFVPPFSRPMTWLKKGAFSIGDRAIGPNFKGNDIQKIIPLVIDSGYSWMRTSYRTLLEKIFQVDNPRNLERRWHNENGLACVPNNYVGFDEKAINLIDLAIRIKRDIIISAHPSALSRSGSENIENFKLFIDFVIEKQFQKKINISLLKDA